MSERPCIPHVIYQRTFEYDVIKTAHLFSTKNLALLSDGRIENGRRFIVVDEIVESHYATEMQNYFAYHGVEIKIVRMAGGEENKTVENYLSIVRELDSFPIHRRDEPIIAIGGGVLTDLVGFVASSYRRGVPHIKVPTTLLGYVDASIGIKTSINFNDNKNRLGAFAPPQKVFLDRSFLKTLSRRHLLNGMGEIIKLAVIRDVGLFRQLEEHGAQSVEAKFQNEAGDIILDSAICGMLEELTPNLFEEDLARKVDFGHTFSYGLETRFEERLFHGEAVLLDISISLLIARARNLISEEDTNRVFNLIKTLGICIDTAFLDPELLWRSLEERTYHRNGFQRVPIPHGIGKCNFLNDVTPGEIESAVKYLEDRITVQHDVI